GFDHLADPVQGILEAREVRAQRQHHVLRAHAAQVLEHCRERARIRLRVFQADKVFSAVIGAGHHREAPQGHGRIGPRGPHGGAEQEDEEPTFQAHDRDPYFFRSREYWPRPRGRPSISRSAAPGRAARARAARSTSPTSKEAAAYTRKNRSKPGASSSSYAEGRTT